MAAARVELVAGDNQALNLVVVVEPEVGDFTAVLEDVVGHRQVVGTDFIRLVAPVVRRALGHHANTTIDEGVAVDDVAVSAVHLETDVVVVDGVVELGVSVEVNERAVGDLEEVKFVVAVVAVAHGTNDRSNTGNGGVVHVDVQRVVSVAQVEPLWVAAAGNSDGGHRGVVHVERGFTVEVRVQSVGVVEVVGGRGDPRASVPVVAASTEVHERSVHHDGLASQVVASEAAEVAVFDKTVAVGSASTGRDACASVLLGVSGRRVADSSRELVFHEHRVGIARSVREGHRCKHVAEVSSVVAAAAPVVVDRCGCHCGVADEVLCGQTAAVHRLRGEEQVVGHTVRIRLSHAGDRTGAVLEDNGGVGHVLGHVRDVGLEGDVELSLAAELTGSGDLNCRGVNASFDEVHVGGTRHHDVLGVRHHDVGQREITASVGFDTDGVVRDGHVAELNVVVGSAGVLERCTGRSRDGTRNIATHVALVEDTGNGLVFEVDVHEVHLAGARVGHANTVVASGDAEAIRSGCGLSDDLKTGLGWADNRNVLEVACGKGATDFDTGVGARDGAVLEQGRT